MFLNHEIYCPVISRMHEGLFIGDFALCEIARDTHL